MDSFPVKNDIPQACIGGLLRPTLKPQAKFSAVCLGEPKQ